MRHPLFASLLAVISMLPVLAQAMDCKKASSTIEQMICADPRLMGADAAMGKAYSASLKAAPDDQVRAMLVASQRRWVVARDNRLGDLADSVDGQTGEGYSKEEQHDIVLKAMQARTGQLADTAKQPRLIQMALEQRAFAGRFTGGTFAGFDTSCDFLPQSGSYSYGCFGTRFYQQNNRICSVSQDWASGGVYETRAVAEVVDGKPKLIATCKLADNECSGANQAGWNVKEGALDADMQRVYEQRGTKTLAQLDGEIDARDDTAWLQSCLTDPRFPAAGAAQ